MKAKYCLFPSSEIKYEGKIRIVVTDDYGNMQFIHSIDYHDFTQDPKGQIRQLEVYEWFKKPRGGAYHEGAKQLLHYANKLRKINL